MAETRCKYYKQKKQVSYDGGQTWQDVIPYQYQKGELYEYESADCGAVIVYRWTNMDPSTDYYCEGTTKRYKQKKQVSFDGGTTWQDVVPAEYQEGGVAEQRSTDCGYVPPTPQYRWIKSDDTICVEILYRWVNMDASVDYYCEGTTKYYKQKQQVSNDGGQTWQDVTPPEYQKGDVAETQSTDCGYVPPTPPTGKKFVANYTGVGTIEVECNSSTELTRSETHRGYSGVAMISAVIGQCVTKIGLSAFEECTGLANIDIPNSIITIGERAFYHCKSLTSVTIPNSVTLIDYQAFIDCYGLTSVTIPDSVTAIGTYAFDYCSGLTSVTVNAVTPPTLGTDVFKYTNDCPIYVPAASVSAYKSASGWSTYASRIQAIP